MNNDKIINQIAYSIVEMLSCLHDCHVCEYPEEQINGKGRKRTQCTKYNQPVKRVRESCIDRFPAFNMEEWEEIAEQYKAGKMELVIKGVSIRQWRELSEKEKKQLESAA